VHARVPLLQLQDGHVHVSYGGLQMYRVNMYVTVNLSVTGCVCSLPSKFSLCNARNMITYTTYVHPSTSTRLSQKYNALSGRTSYIFFFMKRGKKEKKL
jgi:hypothetical protein